MPSGAAGMGADSIVEKETRRDQRDTEQQPVSGQEDGRVLSRSMSRRPVLTVVVRHRHPSSAMRCPDRQEGPAGQDTYLTRVKTTSVAHSLPLIRGGWVLRPRLSARKPVSRATDRFGYCDPSGQISMAISAIRVELGPGHPALGLDGEARGDGHDVGGQRLRVPAGRQAAGRGETCEATRDLGLGLSTKPRHLFADDLRFRAGRERTLDHEAAFRRAAAADEFDLAHQHGARCRLRARRPEGFVVEAPGIPTVVLHGLEEEALLVAVSGIQARDRDADGLRQRRDRGAFVTMAPEQAQRDVQSGVEIEGTWAILSAYLVAIAIQRD